jgi:hypothetical protein
LANRGEDRGGRLCRSRADGRRGYPDGAVSVRVIGRSVRVPGADDEDWAVGVVQQLVADRAEQ